MSIHQSKKEHESLKSNPRISRDSLQFALKMQELIQLSTTVLDSVQQYSWTILVVYSCLFFYTVVDWTRHKAYKTPRINSRVGIHNDGNICYLSAALQSYYHFEKVRNAVLNWDRDSLTLGMEAVLQANEEERRNFEGTPPLLPRIYALQDVFEHLYEDDGSIHVKMFLRQMEEDHGDQEDISEFLSSKLDGIMEAMVPHFRRVYQIDGRDDLTNPPAQRDFTENMIILELPPDINDLNHLLDHHVAPTLVDGTGGEPLARQKTIRLMRLPEILRLQFKRFVYNAQKEVSEKADSIIRFPIVLDMNPYLAAASTQKNFQNEHTFYLSVIIIQTGGASGGHYYIYVNNPNADALAWFKLDDDDVTSVTQKQAVVDNFGGYAGKKIPLETLKKKPKLRLKSTSAYMLVYLRRDQLTHQQILVYDQAQVQLDQQVLAFNAEVQQTRLEHVQAVASIGQEEHRQRGGRAPLTRRSSLGSVRTGKQSGLSTGVEGTSLGKTKSKIQQSKTATSTSRDQEQPTRVRRRGASVDEGRRSNVKGQQQSKNVKERRRGSVEERRRGSVEERRRDKVGERRQDSVKGHRRSASVGRRRDRSTSINHST